MGQPGRPWPQSRVWKSGSKLASCADANYQSLRYIALEDEDMQLAGSSLLRSARASDEANQEELEVQNMLFLSYSKILKVYSIIFKYY